MTDKQTIIEIVDGHLVNVGARKLGLIVVVLVCVLFLLIYTVGRDNGANSVRAEWAVSVATEARDEAKELAKYAEGRERMTQIYDGQLLAWFEAHSEWFEANNMNPPLPPKREQE